MNIPKLDQVLRTSSVSITDDGVVHLHFTYRGDHHGINSTISISSEAAGALAAQIVDALQSRPEPGTTTTITEDKP